MATKHASSEHHSNAAAHHSAAAHHHRQAEHSHSEGKHDDALKALSAAADAEDKTEKSPVTPGTAEPARELYGIMLLERGMAREAFAAFEATIKKEPNRFNATAGAAKAASLHFFEFRG